MFQINIVAVFCLDCVDVLPQLGNDSHHSLLEPCIHTEQCVSLFLFQVGLEKYILLTGTKVRIISVILVFE